MNKLFIPLLSAILLLPVHSFAADKYCAAEATCGLGNGMQCPIMTSVVFGGASETHYYNNYGVTSALECPDGYELTLKFINIPGCTNKISYNACEKSCAPCTNCLSDTTWSSAGIGYEKRTLATCNCGTCKKTTSYRCAANYYGSSTNGTSGCTSCASGTGNSAARSPAGTPSITDCYLPGGTTVSDDSGEYKFSDKCNYKFTGNILN